MRQELLTGIVDEAKFDSLRHHLRGFDDEPLVIEDYETAARFSNICLSNGIAGSPADLLICAVAAGRGLPVSATDLGPRGTDGGPVNFER